MKIHENQIQPKHRCDFEKEADRESRGDDWKKHGKNHHEISDDWLPILGAAM